MKIDSSSCFFGLHFYGNTHRANNSVSHWMQLIEDYLPRTMISINIQTERPWPVQKKKNIKCDLCKVLLTVQKYMYR
jgi:hypothetical protein